MRGPLCTHAGWSQGCRSGSHRGRGGLLTRPEGGQRDEPFLDHVQRGAFLAAHMHRRVVTAMPFVLGWIGEGNFDIGSNIGTG